ncbi:MAG: hypothetical protein COU27_01935 [Candidatus Levybacteria bacterium CG10_big_fil_rev_8_21_14_0_10_36_7]|nr:MAG: hypothetical protein COU27_01935 [Candidatus Levybacteria bacterium CG10_big_fil_rev_8_21_14_0_10_36_7]
MPNKIKELKYFIKGMHCASCEFVVEKKLLELENVKSVDASLSKGEVFIEYAGQQPSVGELNKIFQESGYMFSETGFASEEKNNPQELVWVFAFSFIILVGFLLMEKSGLSNLINVTNKSSLFSFLVLGLFAGMSSCMALVGGLILSMSKQWSEVSTGTDSFFKKAKPHLMFNTGRIISYSFFGMILGGIGGQLQLSLKFTSVLVFFVSAIMIILALQMLGVRAFQKFRISLPKFMIRKIADKENLSDSRLPFLIGATTFFLPCGFTITVQGLALLSGNAIQGGLIMLAFALGTLPMLMLIGFSSIKFNQDKHWSSVFMKVAGVLVLFFAIFNVNAQLNVLGLSSLNDIKEPLAQIDTDASRFAKFFKPIESNNSLVELPEIIDGKQIIKMEVGPGGYFPNYFKVRAGVPVKWKISDVGASGCTNAVISRSLFDGEVRLVSGKTVVKEFIPTKIGKNKFSCWMGMVSGTIEVVE